jgi:ketosteroid isomerase-like protein
MRSTQLSAVGILGLLMLSGAGQSLQPGKAVNAPATATEAFAAQREVWARNLHDKRVDASVAEYAKDAEFIDPSGDNSHGSVAIRKLFERVTATFDSELIFHSGRVENSGDLAYDAGSYQETLTARATGAQQVIGGSYLTIYRRSKNGTWMIVEQMWTMAANADQTSTLGVDK